jgi:hypothetical protein
MRIFGVDLGEIRQTDGFTCGPTAALVAAALLDRAYADTLDRTPEGLAREQHRIHRAANRIWPRRLGTTPAGVAATISRHGVPYRWRRFRRGDALDDVAAAVARRLPVALLVGRVVPRHWLLLVEHPEPGMFRLFDPSSGRLRDVDVDALRTHRMSPGFPRAYALVLPR